MQNFRVGHVHLIFLCVNLICTGSRFSVEYGLEEFIFDVTGDLDGRVLTLCVKFKEDESKFSTAMQKHSRWVLALAWTPNATLLHHLTQNIPTCWYILALPIPDAKPKICVILDAKPKICNPRVQSVEYRWRWAF